LYGLKKTIKNWTIKLYGHLTVDSFDSKYKFCKDRLGLESVASDFNVYLELNKKSIEMYEKLNKVADNLEKCNIL
jgi:hypothetical protein